MPPTFRLKKPGPFEQAQINARKFAENAYRLYLLQDLLEQIELAEEAIEQAEEEVAKKMALLVKEELEKTLDYMLSTGGKENDNETKTRKVPRKTL